MATSTPVTGAFGNEPIELNNAATEASLRDLITATTVLNNNIIRLPSLIASATTGGTSGRTGIDLSAAASGMIRLGTAVNAPLKGLELLNIVLGKVTQGIGFLVGVVAGVAEKFAALTEQLIEGGMTVSKFFDSFKDMPLFIGEVASLFAKLARLQEAEMDTYRKLTSAGMNFAGQLTDIRKTALSLGMDLQSFGALFSNSKVSESLGMMGASVEDSRKQFMAIVKEMRRPGGFGMELQNLGYTTQQYVEMTAAYIKMTGGRSAAEMKNVKEITVAATEYAKQIDYLARITGKSREALENESIKRNSEDHWKRFLQDLTPDSQRMATMINDTFGTMLGEGAAASLRQSMAGLPGALTDAARTAFLTYGEANRDEIMKLIKSNDPTAVIKSVAEKIKKSAEQASKFNIEALTAMSVTNGPNAEFAKMLLNSLNIFKRYNNDVNQLTKSLTDEYLKKVATGEQVSAANRAKLALDDLALSIYEALMPAIEVLTPFIKSSMVNISDWVQQYTPEIKKSLEQLAPVFANSISKFFTNMVTSEGRDRIADSIIDLFADLFLRIRLSIGRSSPKSIDFGVGISQEDYDKEKEILDKRAENREKEYNNSKKILESTTDVFKHEQLISKLKAEIGLLESVNTEEAKARVQTLKNQLVEEEAYVKLIKNKTDTPLVNNMRDLISLYEGTSEGKFSSSPALKNLKNDKGINVMESGYDTMFNDGKHLLPSELPPRPLTKMTLREIKEWAKKFNSINNQKLGVNTSALGRYQIQASLGDKSTLGEAQKALGLTDDALYDKNTQDRMADYLIKKRLKPYFDGKISKEEAMKRFGDEWQSFAPALVSDTAPTRIKRNAAMAELSRRIDDIKKHQQSTHRPLEITPVDVPEEKQKSKVELEKEFPWASKPKTPPYEFWNFMPPIMPVAPVAPPAVKPPKAPAVKPPKAPATPPSLTHQGHERHPPAKKPTHNKKSKKHAEIKSEDSAVQTSQISQDDPVAVAIDNLSAQLAMNAAQQYDINYRMLNALNGINDNTA